MANDPEERNLGGNPNQEARDGKGRYVRTPDGVRRDARAAELKGPPHLYTYQQIADELGYGNRGDAWRGVQRARLDIIREPAQRLVDYEAEQLEALYGEVLEVLATDHVTVCGGKILLGLDGRPLLDDGPKLSAVDRGVKVRESVRKLKGIDAKQPLEITLGRRLDLEGEAVANALIAALDALPELTEEQRTRALEAAQQRLLEET